MVYDSASFQTGLAHIPPYLSNGIVGGSFDHMGFQSMPNKGVPNGRTVLGYIGHYYMHGPTTRQAQLPLAWIGAAFADQTIPNLFIMKIERQSDSPEKELVVNINCRADLTQQSSIEWLPEPISLKFEVNGNTARVVSSTNMVNTSWTVTSDNDINLLGEQLQIRLKDGENIIRFQVDRDDVGETGMNTNIWGFTPWTPPFDMWDEFEKHGVAGTDSYQVHNNLSFDGDNPIILAN